VCCVRVWVRGFVLWVVFVSHSCVIVVYVFNGVNFVCIVRVCLMKRWTCTTGSIAQLVRAYG
jgi:hypothetical protein